MTFDEFTSLRGGQSGGPARRFVQSLTCREPRAIPSEIVMHYKDAGAAIRQTSKLLNKQVFIRTIDGTLYACLMPEAGNSK